MLRLALRIALPVSLVALGLLAVSPGATAKPTAWSIDTGHSAIIFKINHLGVSYSYGRFNTFEGSFETNPADHSKSWIKLTIQAGSIDTNDEKRDGHLKGPDFFGVGEFPTITFTSKSVTKTNDGIRVAGDLTLHGVTKPVTVRMNKIGEGKGPYGKYRIGFHGTVRIKRSDFGMNKMIPMIGDDVELMLSIEATQN